MWSVVLKILSILGIILLCLLALALVTLLLALFCPVSYRGGGSAQAKEYRAWFRFRWLFGLVRGCYAYPESGSLRVKVLWLTVYDSGGKREKSSPEDKLSKQDAEAEEREQAGKASAEGERQIQPERAAVKTERQMQPEQTADKTEEQMQPEQTAGKTEEQMQAEQTADKTEEQMRPEQTAPEAGAQISPNPAASEESLTGEAERASADNGEQGASKGSSAAGQARPLPEKLSGLKEKLQLYLEIVRDEDNQGLVKHGLTRLGKILKSIRPRFLRAEALVGLGEPDLTGYVYGIYWAVKPFLGKKCHVAVTPDFERQVLEGEATLGGRIMAAMILRHAVRVLLDRRLRQLLDKLKGQE